MGGKQQKQLTGMNPQKLQILDLVNRDDKTTVCSVYRKVENICRQSGTWEI